jgi:hypothetical protein
MKELLETPHRCRSTADEKGPQVLRRAEQHLAFNLREVAQYIAETDTVPSD